MRGLGAAPWAMGRVVAQSLGVDWTPVVSAGIEAATAITTTAITHSAAEKKEADAKKKKKKKKKKLSTKKEEETTTPPAPKEKETPPPGIPMAVWIGVAVLLAGGAGWFLYNQNKAKKG